jgi:hypothetical protein
VSVAEVDTVVRLDGRGGLLAELVLTGDVAAALEEVLGAARGPAGAGFFVVGPFGSGKSHFLSAAGELMAGSDGARALGGWGLGLQQAARAARRSLPVQVPLVEYRAEAALEDVVRARAWRALGSPAPVGGTDRSEHWGEVLASAGRAGYEGLVLLVDEASEWLRAKRGPALTEDLRFLQFLGEWARGQPVVVLVALQESIEEVANVSEKELARIRDRYGGLGLSMRHVEDLVRGRLVRLEPGAERWVATVGKGAAASFPGAPVEIGRFARCYPLHPGTLDLLEGLKFLLSQNRGVVDFVCRQVRADLTAPCSSLVTPDRIYDHFRDRLHERRESARLADAVVPYYERAVEEMFDPTDRPLALRTVKLLCLLAASPLERPRSAAELAGMLLAKVSDTEPAVNVAYLEEVVLRPLVARGAYVVASTGSPVTYSVEVGADAAVTLQARVAAVRAELSESDRRMVATVVELGSTPSLPLDLMAKVGPARRETLWHNTLRWVLVGPARVADMAAPDVGKLVEQARGCGAEGVLVVAEVELAGAEDLVSRARSLVAHADRVAIWVPAVPSPDELDSLGELHSRRLVREQALSEDRSDLVELLDRLHDTDGARARELLRRLYFAGTLVAGEGGPSAGPDLPSLAGLSFDRQLPALVDPLLARLHPMHARIAPRGELVGQRYLRQLVSDVIVPGRLGAAALDRGGLRGLVAGYLVPLGLARLRKDGMAMAPDPARSPAVAGALHLVGEGAPVPAAEVMAALADGPLGLSEPEALLVLNACVQAGLVELWRGRKKVGEPFLALTAAERLGPGELVEPALREVVAALSPVVTGPGPFEPWTSSTQSESWEYARAWAQARREDAAQARAGLAQLAEVPALTAVDSSAVRSDLRAVQAVLEACSEATSPAQGLRALARAADGPAADGPAADGPAADGPAADGPAADGPAADGAVDAATGGAGAGGLIAAGRRLAALARFFRDDLRRVEEAASYLVHPDLVLTEGEESLRSLRSEAVEMLPQLLRLVAEDRLAELASANREFRRAYVATYQRAHDRHYAAVGPAAIGKVRDSATYRALAALSGAGAFAVPDDRVKVDRMLAGAAPAPCSRRVENELSWKPRCACGFGLGDPLPSLDSDAVLAVAERGFRQHLTELSNPAVAQRLGDAAAQLEVLGRKELGNDLRQLLELASRPQGTGPLPVASLVGQDLQGVLRDVVSGGQLIVTRDLAALREDLIGRRYPKRRLVELLAAWVDPDGAMPPTAFVEVEDSSEGTAEVPGRPGPAQPRAVVPAQPGRPGGTPTVVFLRSRFPELAAALPVQQAADAFWLAAWWAGRPGAPGWVPSSLVEDPRLARAAEAARADLGALGELEDLDSRCGPATVLGGQVGPALGLSSADLASVVAALCSERLLRYPVQLAADQLVRRLAAGWQGTGHVDRLAGGKLDVARVASEHYLLAPEEVAALGYLLDAARHLAEVERRLAHAGGPELVEGIYADHIAPVAELVSRASLATAGRSVLRPEVVEMFRASAGRLLAAAGTAFSDIAEAGFPGCLLFADVGRAVIDPLLAVHGRVAVVLVDAMRADASRLVAAELAAALPGRRLEWRWAVVPAPTRTAEAMAALALGRPVPAGSAPTFAGSVPAGWVAAGAGWAGAEEGGAGGSGEPWPAPFGHLGYEVALLKGADRDDRAQQLRDLWASRSPVMVAVASALDERLHHSSVELAVLLDDASRTISRRVLASLVAVPRSVPVVLMADHGFRENPVWGKGPEGRYVHGGTSLEECVVPVVVAS